MAWLPDHIQLEGKYVKLLPLEEKHFADVIKAAADKRIWEFYFFDGADPEQMLTILNKAMEEKEQGIHYPFIIIHKEQNKIIGSTRFLDIQAQHRKLEIGFTWLNPAYWASHINPECKLLLLTYCFETLNAIRVQLKANEHNIRSRTAIMKIGAKFEGILRNEVIQANGNKRNSAYYSILDTEWREVKNDLINFLNERLQLITAL